MKKKPIVRTKGELAWRSPDWEARLNRADRWLLGGLALVGLGGVAAVLVAISMQQKDLKHYDDTVYPQFTRLSATFPTPKAIYVVTVTQKGDEAFWKDKPNTIGVEVSCNGRTLGRTLLAKEVFFVEAIGFTPRGEGCLQTFQVALGDQAPNARDVRILDFQNGQAVPGAARQPSIAVSRVRAEFYDDSRQAFEFTQANGRIESLTRSCGRSRANLPVDRSISPSAAGISLTHPPCDERAKAHIGAIQDPHGRTFEFGANGA